MAVRALGAGQLVDAEGTWPTNYVNFANEEGLLDDVNAIYTATATRLQAALIVSNSLDTEMWAKSAVKSNGELTWSKNGKTIIEDVLKLQEVKFVVDEISNNDSEVKVLGLKDSESKYIADTLKDGKYDVNEAFDLSTIKKGLTYTAYVDEDNNIMSMWIEDDSYEFTKIADNYDADKFEIDLIVNGKEKTYSFATKMVSSTETIDAVLYINEKTETDFTKLAKNAGLFGSIVVNDKNEITAVYATQYNQFGIVDEVTKSTVKFENGSSVVVPASTGAANITYTKDTCEYFLTKDGKGISYADLKEGDAVEYYYVTASKKYVGEVMTNSVEGKVTAVASSYVKIDGKKYEGFISGLKNDDEIVAYLNVDGRIAFYEKVEKAVSDMALVSYVRKVSGKYGDDYEIKLLFTDGTESGILTVDLEDSYDELDDAAGTYVVTGKTATSDKETQVRNYISTTLAAKTASQLNGALTGYEINGDKVTLCKLDTAEVNDDNKALTVGKKTVALGSYYITEDTTLIKLKADKEYSVKSEVVDFNDLDDVTTAAKAIVVGIDDDTNEVETVYFAIGYGLKRTAETNFVFVKDVAETKYNDEKAYEITAFTLDGETVTYTYCEKEADSAITIPSDIDDLKGTLHDYVVIDGMIVDEEAHTVASGTPAEDELSELTKIDSKDMYIDDVLATRAVLTNGTAADNKTILLAENVLVVLDKGSNKFEVKSFDDIDDYEVDTDSNILSDKVTKVISYTDDVETEAIVVIYTDNYKD